MAKLETKQFMFNYNKTFVRCFKFYSIISTCHYQSVGADIDQVDFYGHFKEIQLSRNEFGCPKEIQVTCNVCNRLSLELFLMFIVE